MWYFDEGSIGILIVEQWCPIRRLVCLYFAGYTAGIQKGRIRCVDADVYSTSARICDDVAVDLLEAPTIVWTCCDRAPGLTIGSTRPV